MVWKALEEGGGSLLMVEGRGEEEIFSLRGICPACGIGLQDLDPRLFSFNSKQGACHLCDGLGVLDDPYEDKSEVCPKCDGSRLKPEALGVKIGGYSIWDLVQHSANHVHEMLKGFSFTRNEALIAKPIMAEILARLSFMNRLGLSYLSLQAVRRNASVWPRSLVPI
jgi:excinuclease ABC subunit A